MQRIFIGVDLGTTAVKVLAVTADGARVAFAAERYGLVTPAPLVVEQDVEVLYAATMRTVARVVAAARAHGEIAAIGFSSAMHGVVCIDAGGRPLTNAITWMDRRSTAIADAWRADGTARALYARTGAPMHPMLPVAKIRWLVDHAPATVARTARFAGLKELIVWRWTGEWRVDWGIASATGMFALDGRRWDPDALALAGIDAAQLSPPAPPSTSLGLRPDVRATLGLRLETVVVLASSDGALATIGSGAGAGDVAVTLGTSGAVRTLVDAPLLDAQARTFCYCADDARYVAGGPTSSAGASLDWLFALLLDDVPVAQRFDRAAELAAASEPGAAGCTMLPFLAGERAPYWNASLRGSIAGLDLTHDRRAVLRAAFEGVVFGVFAVYAIVRAHAGDAERLVVTGGLTQGALVRALLADVFGVPAVRPREDEAAALGAALVAAHARGDGGDPLVTARAIGTAAADAPVAAHAPAYAAAFARYEALVAAALALQPPGAAVFRA